MLVAHPPCRPIHAGWMPPHTRFAPSIAVASGVASRHGRLMRQSCHRIGMAIFTALSPQVASARPLALLDGLAPFRCSSRERDMSMANITRRKKGFPAGEKGGRHHLHPLSLSPQRIRHREGKAVKMRRNGCRALCRSWPRFTSRERVASMVAESGISPAWISAALSIWAAGDRPIYEVLLMPGTRSLACFLVSSCA